jgi:hypothetical protein
VAAEVGEESRLLVGVVGDLDLGTARPGLAEVVAERPDHVER